MPEPLLDVRDLRTSFSTDAGELVAVDGVSLSIPPGGRFGLVGESGSGKSAALWSIVGLVDPPGKVTAERIAFEGIDLLRADRRTLRRLRGGRIGFVMQDPLAALSPVFTVGDQIVETIRCHERVARREARERAVELLAGVGIQHPDARVHDYPHQLSGGMRQRVAIAIALACSPSLLIADEPTTALDVTIQAQVLELLLKLSQDRGMAVLVVTHDLGVIGRFADEVAVMYAGRIVEHGTVDALLRAPRHPYTEALLVSQPRLDTARVRELASIPGAPPDLARLPPGCSFAPRCHRRAGRRICAEQEPALRKVGTGHESACHFAEELEVAPATIAGTRSEQP